MRERFTRPEILVRSRKKRMDMVSIDLEKVRTLYEKIPILMLLHQVTVSLAVGIQNSITLKHVASLSGRITITGKL